MTFGELKKTIKPTYAMYDIGELVFCDNHQNILGSTKDPGDIVVNYDKLKVVEIGLYLSHESLQLGEACLRPKMKITVLKEEQQ